jgi:hypothetical protein
MEERKLYKNILSPGVAGYAGLGDDLRAYLKEIFGEDIDFNVTVSAAGVHNLQHVLTCCLY